MKVKDLITKLQEYPEDMEVVIDGTFDPDKDIEFCEMAEFYVIMQKRQDGKVYTDLHKTNQVIYLTKEDAEDALNCSHHYKQYYHVVKLIACLEDEYGHFEN